jgi:hypothetical protein
MFEDLITKYYLDGVVQGAKDDEDYYLAFNTAGEMYVLLHFSPNKMYARSTFKRIEIKDLDTYTVNGVPLRNLVVDMLKRKLPPEKA